MKIGVLRAGPVADELVSDFGEYDRVFADYLGPHDPDFTFQGWAVYEGDLPNAPDEADAWIISGSKFGVYENHNWIEPLKDFVRAIVAARIPLIGVCFGHQIMAEALGGCAVKFGGGWGIGRHTYKTMNMPSWMADAPEEISIHAIHQDQVIKRPPDAIAVASNDFCENAALIYGDPEAPYAISIQPHPEFSDKFVKDLIAVRLDTFPAHLRDQALADMGAVLHREWAAGWFRRFLEVSTPKKQAR